MYAWTLDILDAAHVLTMNRRDMVRHEGSSKGIQFRIIFADLGAWYIIALDVLCQWPLQGKSNPCIPDVTRWISLAWHFSRRLEAARQVAAAWSVDDEKVAGWDSHLWKLQQEILGVRQHDESAAFGQSPMDVQCALAVGEGGRSVEEASAQISVCGMSWNSCLFASGRIVHLLEYTPFWVCPSFMAMELCWKVAPCILPLKQPDHSQTNLLIFTFTVRQKEGIVAEVRKTIEVWECRVPRCQNAGVSCSVVRFFIARRCTLVSCKRNPVELVSQIFFAK